MPPHQKTRRWRRLQVDLPIQLYVRNGSSQIVVPGRAMEISEGGFSAMLTEEFQIGEAVEVSFELPSTGHITMDATVRNKNLFRYGFEFNCLSEEARQQITKACESLPHYEGGW